jgi:hypothetical protein
MTAVRRSSALPPQRRMRLLRVRVKSKWKSAKTRAWTCSSNGELASKYVLDRLSTFSSFAALRAHSIRCFARGVAMDRPVARPTAEPPQDLKKSWDRSAVRADKRSALNRSQSGAWEGHRLQATGPRMYRFHRIGHVRLSDPSCCRSAPPSMGRAPPGICDMKTTWPNPVPMF